MKNVLGLIQDVTLELFGTQPTSIVGSNDKQNIQLLALMNRSADILKTEHDWQVLATRYQFDTVNLNYTGIGTANTRQISMPNTSGITTDFQVTGIGIPLNTMVTAINPNVSVTISNTITATSSGTFSFGQVNYPLPADFGYLVPDTSFDTANRWDMNAVNAQGWAYLKSGFSVAGIRERFRIINGKFSIYPVQSTTRQFTFEYQSKYPHVSNMGVRKEYLTADTDTSLLPDNLIVMGTKLKYWEQKEFDTTILKADYDREVSKYKGMQGASESITGVNRAIDLYPLNVPEIGYGS